ncbi:MAG: hypothetical protein ABSF49_04070 [Roseiarcus sp.]|jgi:hypothetical protein|uniref:hypothetical protein n=1 Tax=Roseiarcus sp. TaxID=1969460 RepID=UPI003C1CBE1D
MSFFTDAEASSLRIARISLHIVSDDEFRPEPELAIEHDDFLLDRIRDVAPASVYRFDDVSAARDTIEAIATRKVGFEEGAQTLAREFCRFHQGNTRDGAFFVFELGTDDESVRLYALMKYDYGQALELIEREGAAGLRRIVEAFIDDKSAIQKSALVRVVNGSAEASISTRDRMGRPAPQLTDYFIRYLQVVRDRTDSELTTAVKDVVRAALEDHREHLPSGGVAPAVSRALEVLRNTETITEDVVNHAVWMGAGQPADDQVCDSLKKSVGRLVKRKRLAGVAFPPDGTQLARPITRLVRTEEGVTIQYNTGLEGQAVRKTELSDGETQFIITTRKYTDAVLSESSGRRR